MDLTAGLLDELEQRVELLGCRELGDGHIRQHSTADQPVAELQERERAVAGSGLKDPWKLIRCGRMNRIQANWRHIWSFVVFNVVLRPAHSREEHAAGYRGLRVDQVREYLGVAAETEEARVGHPALLLRCVVPSVRLARVQSCPLRVYVVQEHLLQHRGILGNMDLLRLPTRDDVVPPCPGADHHRRVRQMPAATGPLGGRAAELGGPVPSHVPAGSRGRPVHRRPVPRNLAPPEEVPELELVYAAVPVPVEDREEVAQLCRGPAAL